MAPFPGTTQPVDNLVGVDTLDHFDRHGYVVAQYSDGEHLVGKVCHSFQLLAVSRAALNPEAKRSLRSMKVAIEEYYSVHLQRSGLEVVIDKVVIYGSILERYELR